MLQLHQGEDIRNDKAPKKRNVSVNKSKNPRNKIYGDAKQICENLDYEQCFMYSFLRNIFRCLLTREGCINC